MEKIYNFLKNIADKNYIKFKDMNFCPAGKNGPYQFKDTPVRNTAHWSIIYSYLWKKTNENKYKELAFVFLEYLLSEQKKSASGAIQCMEGKEYDKLNGLIGQAWVIEALIYAAKVYNIEKFYDVAIEIFNSQIFDENEGIWYRTDLDGTKLGFDYTTNHQVWFAASGLMILDYKFNKEIACKIDEFLNIINDKHFDIYSDGLIKHYLKLKRPPIHSKYYYFKQNIKNLIYPLKKFDPNRFDKKSQEIGYHLFELYGYGIVKQYRPEYKLYDKICFQKAVNYGLNIDKLNKKMNVYNFFRNPKAKLNFYTYGYNSPAFEYPYIEYIFKGKCTKQISDKLLDIQEKITLNNLTGMLERNTNDAETLTARCYELVRLLDIIDGKSIKGEKNENN